MNDSWLLGFISGLMLGLCFALNFAKKYLKLTRWLGVYAPLTLRKYLTKDHHGQD